MLAPISCSKVDLFMTQNEGPTGQSGGSKPNSGSASVTIPADLDGAARLKVACSDNIFFAISPLKLRSPSAVKGEAVAAVPSVFWTLALALLGWQRRRA
jgi:hypothetical protein